MNIKDLHHIFLASKGVVTDTRNISPDTIYFALKGANFDGNKFASQALSLGAKFAVVDDKSLEISEQFILVEDVLSTLQDLATYHRNSFEIPVIALTGSNGKTTSKELIVSVLSKKYEVLYTYGNLNNHIGVPLTLLRLNAKHQMAVIEMGANHQGEIKQLCLIAQPNFGYITNFGKAHLEGFGGFEGVVKGKSELYSFINHSSATLFVNSDDPIQNENTIYSKRITFGFNENATYRFTAIPNTEFATVQYEGLNVVSQLVGEYNTANICAALTIGFHFGVPIHSAIEGITSYVPSNHRSQLVLHHDHSVVLDAYNANPSSMEVAINNFNRNYSTHPKIYILGAMYELGEDSLEEHLKILKKLQSLNETYVILVGHDFEVFKSEFPEFHFFENTTLFIEWLKKTHFEKSYILIKGSRAVALEKVLEFIK